MRYIIAQEQVEAFPNAMLMENSVWWHENCGIHIIAANSSKILGVATDILRDTDNYITAEIEWVDEDDTTCNLSIQLASVEMTMEEEEERTIALVHKGVLCAVLEPIETVPWSTINEEGYHGTPL